MFSRTLGTYQLLGKWKTNNFGEKCFQEREYGFDASRSPWSFSQISSRKAVMRWGGSQLRTGFITTNSFATKGWGVCSTQETCSLGPWPPLCGEEGRLTHSPSPTRQRLLWLEFQLLSGLVQTKTFGLSQIQDLQPKGSSQFTGVLGRHIPSQQELSGPPGGVCVTWSDDTGRINWRRANYSPAESEVKEVFDSVQQSQAFRNSHCAPTVCWALSGCVPLLCGRQCGTLVRSIVYLEDDIWVQVCQH